MSAFVDPAVAASFSDWIAAMFARATRIWIDGGWAMLAIAIDGLLMFAIGTRLWLRLVTKGYRRVPEQVWRLWIEHPSHREGRLGQLIDGVMAAPSLAAASAAFRGMQQAELAPFQRDLKVMKVCVAAAPLFGLFGTVTGMLATFGALATGSGGDQTMAAIAKGISEALITTETGLVVALPGLFFQYRIARQKDAYAAFLAHLETVCTQFLHRQSTRPQAA